MCMNSMQVKDVSIKKIEKLLKSVPEDMEISSISFIDGDYVLYFKKSLSNVQYAENEELRKELRELIRKADCAYSKILSNEEKGEKS